MMHDGIRLASNTGLKCRVSLGGPELWQFGIFKTWDSFVHALPIVDTLSQVPKTTRVGIWTGPLEVEWNTDMESIFWLHIKGLVHFKNTNFLVIYSPKCHPRCTYLSSVENKLKFLRKTIQDFSPYVGLQWWPTG